jgi:hypothetical protein
MDACVSVTLEQTNTKIPCIGVSLVLVPSNTPQKTNILRASTLVHVSSPISRPMQCHIGFLMMWRREKEVVASRNNYLMNETTTS